MSKASCWKKLWGGMKSGWATVTMDSRGLPVGSLDYQEAVAGVGSGEGTGGEVVEVFVGGRRETLVSLAFCRGP